MSGIAPRSPPVELKQRVYDDPREFLGNYKTVLGKEESLQKAAEKDLEECESTRLWRRVCFAIFKRTLTGLI